MLIFENIDVYGIKAALRGMRNPLNSWEKSDSYIAPEETHWFIGPNDEDLAQRLIKGGSEHRKFLRFLQCSFDVTGPLYWWSEFDTYKVGVSRNSCSTMHKITSTELSLDNFTYRNEDEGIMKTIINYLNYLRTDEKISNYDKLVRMKQILPSGYMMKSTIITNYEALSTMYRQREHHKLTEWNTDFVNFIDKLPQSSWITGNF